MQSWVIVKCLSQLLSHNTFDPYVDLRSALQGQRYTSACFQQQLEMVMSIAFCNIVIMSVKG